MNKIFTILLMSMFLLSFTSAIDCWGNLEQFSEIDLIQKCPSCSYVNITAITYPDGTIFMNDAMSQNGTNFNYTLPDSSQLGRITYTTIGDKNGATPPLTEDLCIEITPSGGAKQTTFFFIVIALIYTVAFLGFFAKNPTITLIGGLGMMILGLYLIMNGITLYRDWLTNAIGMFTIAIGAYISFEAGYTLME